MEGIDVTQNVVKLLEPAAFKAFSAYVGACFIGQIGNAIWLWLKKEVPCVMDRFRDDPRATAVAVLTNFGGIIGMAVAIPFGATPLEAAIVMGAMQGLSSDSMLNKNSREIWTNEKRAAVLNKKKDDPDATDTRS